MAILRGTRRRLRKSIRRPTKVHRIRFFCAGGYRGAEYEFWGLFKQARFPPVLSGSTRSPVSLLGTDRLGRDMFSRHRHMGSRISLTIGLIGSFSAHAWRFVDRWCRRFYGGIVDNLVQRLSRSEVLSPQLPSDGAVWPRARECSPIRSISGHAILACSTWPRLRAQVDETASCGRRFRGGGT